MIIPSAPQWRVDGDAVAAKGGKAAAMPAEGRSAWQREMERAMEATWFSHGIIGPGSARTVAGFEAVAPPLLARTDELDSSDGSGQAVSGANELDAGRQAPQARGDSGAADSQAQEPARAGTGAPSAGHAARAPSDVQGGAAPDAAAAAPGPHPVASAPQVLPGVTPIPLARLAAQIAAWTASPVVPAAGPGELYAMAALPPAAAPMSGLAPGWAAAVDTPHDEPEAQAAAKPSVARNEQGEPQPPLRLHAEWSAQGVRIWLGANAGADAAVTQLTPQLLSWLGEQGWRLLSVVCNGRTVYGATAHARDEEAAAGAEELPGRRATNFNTGRTGAVLPGDQALAAYFDQETRCQ